jgi:hypothetical protein
MTNSPYSLRPLAAIAQDIEAKWANPHPLAAIYIAQMKELSTILDEGATTVVINYIAWACSQARGWKGKEAWEINQELLAHLDVAFKFASEIVEFYAGSAPEA